MGLLGEDLTRVLDQLCPSGPVVLAAHSMGAMAVLALAASHGEVFRSGRISAIVLIASSPGRVPTGRASASSCRTGFPWWLGLLVALSSLTKGMPWRTVAQYHDALMAHQIQEPLLALAEVQVTVLAGEQDRWTPVRHSRRIVDLVPGAQLRVLPAAGHYLLRTHPGLLASLLATAVADASGEGRSPGGVAARFGAATRWARRIASRLAGAGAAQVRWPGAPV